MNCLDCACAHDTVRKNEATGMYLHEITCHHVRAVIDAYGFPPTLLEHFLSEGPVQEYLEAPTFCPRLKEKTDETGTVEG